MSRVTTEQAWQPDAEHTGLPLVMHLVAGLVLATLNVAVIALLMRHHIVLGVVGGLATWGFSFAIGWKRYVHSHHQGMLALRDDAQSKIDELADAVVFERGVMEAVSEGVVVLSDTHAIIRFNRAAETIFGLNKLFVMGEQLSALGLVDDNLDLSDDHTQHVDIEGEGGTCKTLAVRCTTLSDGDDTEHVLALRDISEMLRAQRREKELNAEMQEMSRAAGMAEIATGTLHNVGNALNSINIGVGILSKSQRKQRDLIGDCQRLSVLLDEEVRAQNAGGRLPLAVRFAQKLVDEMKAEAATCETEYIRLEEGVEHVKQVVARQQGLAKTQTLVDTVSMPRLIDDALLIAVPRLDRAPFEVATTCTVDVCQLDRHRVLQIVVNLVKNAAEAITGKTPDGAHNRIHVAVTEDDDEGMVRIAVSDTGEGIDDDNADRIFAHGFTTKADGHGFGLHACANAATEMGGHLRCHSDGPGRGATFTLSIPLTPPGEQAANTDSEATADNADHAAA